MVNLDINVLNELTRNKNLNSAVSPIWILKVEQIEIKNKIYLKIFLVRNQSIEELKEINFFISELNSNFIAYVFKDSEQYKDPNIFGCVINIPQNISELKSVSIASIKFKSTLIEFDVNNYRELSFYENVDDINAIKYLKSFNSNIVTFPKVNDKDWLCCCGKINRNENNECLNCHNTKQYIFNDFLKSKNSVEFAMTKFIETVKFDIHLNFEQNLHNIFDKNKIINNLKYLNANFKMQLKSKYDSRVFEYISEFKNKNKLLLDSKATFDENISNYYARFRIPEEFYISILNDNEINAILNEYNFLLNKKLKSKKRWKIVLTSLLAISVIALILSLTVFKPVIINFSSELNARRAEQIADRWNGKWCVTERDGGSYGYENCILIDIKNEKITFYYPSNYIQVYNPKANTSIISEVASNELILGNWPIKTLVESDHSFRFNSDGTITHLESGSLSDGSTYTKEN